ncbi:sensor histidine kinase [Pseudolysinimonas sp.]|uniref:sensor histidine kinase n=1 Tax=Pseudolysinimonas sp. TaxID=2680009 RepID=UPI003F80C106
MRWWRRLSIRWRITIGSVLVAAVLLTAAGALLLQQVQQAQINSDKRILYSATSPYVSLLQQDPGGISDVPRSEERLVIFDPSGKATSGDLPDPLRDDLTRLARLEPGSHFVTRGDTDYLVTARIVNRADGIWRVVAARNETTTTEVVMGNLTNIVLIGGAVLLVGFGFASWFLTTAALRPITAMRRRAETLEGPESDELLPVGPAQDEVSALASTLNAFLARVREATARERQVVADASHELRTPVAVLRGQVELAKRHPDDPDRLLDIDQTAKRLSQLAVDLLTLSSLESDHGRPLGTAVELGVEFQAAGERSRLVAEPSGVAVEFEADGDPAADGYAITATDLGRVVDNLVRNAIAAGGAGTTIRGLLRRGPDELELSIEDDGPGIPEDFLPTATSRFTRVSTATEGAGLGLAIVQRVADRGDGRLELQNVEPHGLRVSLRVPHVDAARPPAV